MHQCGGSCVRKRNPKTLKPSTNANGVTAVASFGITAAIRISLTVSSILRGYPHAFARSAEPYFTSPRLTIIGRSRHGNAQGRTAITTKKLLLLRHARPGTPNWHIGSRFTNRSAEAELFGSHTDQLLRTIPHPPDIHKDGSLRVIIIGRQKHMRARS
jgi:hypothetical protein